MGSFLFCLLRPCICYAARVYLLGHYETWRIAPLSLLVPVVGIASAVILLGETLSGGQFVGAGVIVFGLFLNIFGGSIFLVRWRRG